MNTEEPSYGPLQMLLVGFETTERFRGEIARELLELRGRGMIRVIDARFLYRERDGKVTEVDLGPLLADRPHENANPIARLLGVNGFGANGGNGGGTPSEAFARTAGFALEDLRRLTDEIGLGDYAAVVLVEHVWAARLRAVVRRTGGALRAQGFLTPEVEMLVGAELKARADAETALEIAHAARGASLLEALALLSRRERPSAEQTARSAAEVIRVLVAEGFVEKAEADGAIEALANAGLIESALWQAAIDEAEDAAQE
jgi:hypothetical protein